MFSGMWQCLNYTADADGYLPFTRIRCLSQQYRWGSDEVNPFTCAGTDPTTFTHTIVNHLIIPVCNLIPGFGSMLGVSLGNFIADTGPEIFDKTLSLMPFGLGTIYTELDYFITMWTTVSFRNLFTQHKPTHLVYQSLGLLDFSLDAKQNRMAKVYANDSTTTCKDKSEFTTPSTADDSSAPERLEAFPWADTGCPDAIPLREATLTGLRGGDYTINPLTSRQPGRFGLTVGVFFMEAAALKMSFCARIPICNTNLVNAFGGALYGPSGNSIDCSGHGQCMWNKRKGNHCKCDQGFFYEEDNQQCCPDGQSKEACKAQAMAIDEGGGRQNTAKNQDADATASSQGQNNATSKRAFLAGYQAGTQHSGTGRRLGEKEGQLSDKDDGKKLFSKESSMTAKIAKNAFKIHGTNDVSSRCSGKDTKTCQDVVGCQLKGTACTDASAWHCAVQKKILDCIATRFMSPHRIAWYLDTLCGKTLLDQKKQKWTGCSHGIRAGQECDDDKDCPALINKKWSKLKGQKDPTCITHETVEGCQSALKESCHNLGFQNFAAMAV